MSVIPILLTATIAAGVPVEGRYAGATTLWHCTFAPSADKDYDGWPDQWQRQRGPGFPHYLGIKIADAPSPRGGRCLRFELNGGAAAVHSPPIPIGPQFSYVLEGDLTTEGLRHDRACLSLTFLDQQRRRLESSDSPRIGRASGWQRLCVGPLSPRGNDARFAVIGLHVEPGSREDLSGSVSFGDIWLGRLPRMTLKTSQPCNLFTATAAVEVHCTVSGYADRERRVSFLLEDAFGRELGREQCRLDSAWRPHLPGPGFYRVRATAVDQKAVLPGQELTLAVIEPGRAPAGGEFGWTLANGERPLAAPFLGQLVAQAGVSWVKYPLWFDAAQDAAAAERLIGLVESLRASDIEIVGLLAEPPPSVRKAQGNSSPQSIAGVFAADPKTWYPSLEPVMIRLATQVRWWQLGSDADTGFADDADGANKAAKVKGELDRIGEDVNLCIAAEWNQQLPPATDGKAPWRAVALPSDPPLTAAQLADQLDQANDAALRHWIPLQPLSRTSCPNEVRAADLVHRMLAAKVHGAAAVFCPEPFSTDRGLMNDDGTPGELFLPWRSTALMLGGAEHRGSLQLPNGSPNHVFARGNDIVMIVWNKIPTEELVYLGEQAQQVDLWGRRTALVARDGRQAVQCDRLPSFVVGLSAQIARWRLGTAFARPSVPSILRTPQENGLALANTFSRVVEGRAKLAMPQDWLAEPREFTFRLAAGEQLQQPLEITLPYGATSGPQVVRIDFAVQADRPYRFSVYRAIEVGRGDVYLEASARLNDQGELEVEQRLVNETDRPVSFACHLLAPDRRPLKTQITALNPGRDVYVYRLPRGGQMLGQTLRLRADEIDGPRTLNCTLSPKLQNATTDPVSVGR